MEALKWGHCSYLRLWGLAQLAESCIFVGDLRGVSEKSFREYLQNRLPGCRLALLLPGVQLPIWAVRILEECGLVLAKGREDGTFRASYSVWRGRALRRHQIRIRGHEVTCSVSVTV